MVAAWDLILIMASGLAGALVGVVLGPYFQHLWSRPRVRLELLHRMNGDSTFAATNRGRTGVALVRTWSISSPLALENEKEEGRFYEPRRGLVHQSGVAFPVGDVGEIQVGPYARVEFRVYFPNVLFSPPGHDGHVAMAWFQDARGKKYKVRLTDLDKPHKDEDAFQAEARERRAAQLRGAWAATRQEDGDGLAASRPKRASRRGQGEET